MPGRKDSPIRVGVVGCGALGSPILDALIDGRAPGCVPVGVFAQSTIPPKFQDLHVTSLDELIERSDLIVEAAGQSALASIGPVVIAAIRDLMALSVGALVDDELFRALSVEGRGRLIIPTGAIGGLDTLSAAMLLEPLEAVELTSRKHASALVRPWMDEALVAALENTEGEVEAFSGTARDAVRLFPESANIAAVLALATIGFDRVTVRIMGTQIHTVQHRVAANGKAGSYEFVFNNRPSDSNPRSSAIAAYSVIRALRRLSDPHLIGI
ncbi:MAG: aspartate dehydrogenase [Actinomycetota bacterium]|jgi:aspartate dehydrogenase|nr:aspartate dehydrogenase [Actinomycetota bacterium]